MFAELIKHVKMDCFDIILEYHHPLKTSQWDISLNPHYRDERGNVRPYSPVWLGNVTYYKNNHERLLLYLNSASKKDIELMERYVMNMEEIVIARISYKEILEMTSTRFGVMIDDNEYVDYSPTYTGYGNSCVCRTFTHMSKGDEHGYMNLLEYVQIMTFLCSSTGHKAYMVEDLSHNIMGKFSRDEFLEKTVDNELLPFLKPEYYEYLLSSKKINRYKSFYFTSVTEDGENQYPGGDNSWTSEFPKGHLVM